ncbi:MAG: InlB B-repeat-containing protein [bacterium]
MNIITRFPNLSRELRATRAVVALIALALAFMPLASHAATGPFGGGDGLSAGTAFIIQDCPDLQFMADDLDAYYKLGNDINCDIPSYNTGEGFEPVGSFGDEFTGHFDGQGYTIDGLYINRTNLEGVGLFGSTSGAVIADVKLTNVNIDSGGHTGALVGWTQDDTSIEKVFVSGSVSTAHAGGSTYIYGGGIVGILDGTLANSYSTASVSSITAGDNTHPRAGGLTGYNAIDSLIQNSYASGSILALSSGGGSDGYAGGISGQNYGTIKNSFSTNSPTGSEQSGGVAGWTSGGAVTNSYSVYATLLGSNSGTTVDGGSAGSQALSSFYESDPLYAVYIGSPLWNFSSTWMFEDDSSLPVLGVLSTYTISFDTQGGSSVSHMVGYTAGVVATLPPAPTRSGFTFQEWNTEPDGDGTAYAVGASYTMPANDVTFYAIWEEVEQEETSRHSSSRGGSVQSRVKNLTDTGNADAADALKAQWPQLFPDAQSGAPLALVSVRDLKLGMTGDDVLALQKLLNANGFALAQSGIGAPGNETTFFGPMTRAALARYQAAKGIAPAAGYFGAITRAQMKGAGLGGLWW